jgi:hypothetical protein
MNGCSYHWLHPVKSSSCEHSNPTNTTKNEEERGEGANYNHWMVEMATNVHQLYFVYMYEYLSAHDVKKS